MKFIKTIIISSILLMGCSSSDQVDTSNMPADEEPKNKLDIEFLDEKEEDVGSKVYLKTPDRKIYLRNISAPGCSIMEKTEYSDLNVPETAVIASSSFWAGLQEVLFAVIVENEIVQVYYGSRDEMESGPITYELIERIDLDEPKVSSGKLEVPFFIINTAAVKVEKEAKKKVAELEAGGYEADYLWIPDYESLSGAEYFSVFIGPYKTKQECAIAVDYYQSTNPKAFGTLVSHKNERVTVGGLEQGNK